MTADDRTAAALERIATALEQMALERVSPTVTFEGLPTAEPLLPTPPPDLRPMPDQNGFPGERQFVNAAPTATVPLPPVQPFQFTGPTASCPVHRVPWKTVPAGTSKKTGKPYGAFLVCSVQGCEERPRA